MVALMALLPVDERSSKGTCPWVGSWSSTAATEASVRGAPDNAPLMAYELNVHPLVLAVLATGASLGDSGLLLLREAVIQLIDAEWIRRHD
jgi:hypothetical protein